MTITCAFPGAGCWECGSEIFAGQYVEYRFELAVCEDGVVLVEVLARAWLGRCLEKGASSINPAQPEPILSSLSLVTLGPWVQGSMILKCQSLQSVILSLASVSLACNPVSSARFGNGRLDVKSFLRCPLLCYLGHMAPPVCLSVRLLQGRMS